MSFDIRDMRDADGAALIALMERCWADYPGCVLDVEGDSPELWTPASYFAGLGGRGWVAERDSVIVASIGVAPGSGPGIAELHRLYVDHSARRQGLAKRLVALVEDEARGWDAHTMELWSDVRFTFSHRLYERQGFTRQPGTRELDDASNSVESCFVKSLGDP